MSANILKARNEFAMHEFNRQVAKAMGSVKRILDTTRQPAVAADVPHSYDDKFALAETLTNINLGAQLNCLKFMGVSDTTLVTCREWVQDGKTVTMRFSGTETCKFDRKQEREEKGPTTKVVEATTSMGRKKTKEKEHTVITTITDYLHIETIQTKIEVFAGADPKAVGLNLVVSDRTGTREVKTSTETLPRSATTNIAPIDVDLTWLLSQSSPLAFAINRTIKTCRTPRRNEQIDIAASEAKVLSTFFKRLGQQIESINSRWNHPVSCYVKSEGAYRNNNGSNVFVPVVPIFEKTRPTQPSTKRKLPSIPSTSLSADARALSSSTSTDTPATPTTKGPIAKLHQVASAPNFDSSDAEKLLAEQVRTMEEELAKLAETVPGADSTDVVTIREATLVNVARHCVEVLAAYQQSIDYIEHLLKTQLTAAIGKDITPSAFADFISYHNAKLFKPEHAPQPFTYAVRRPGYYPEGEVTIETKGSGQSESIKTLTRKFEPPASAMKMALNASTVIEFGGPRYLHGYLDMKVAGHVSQTKEIVARARQFSCFMIVLGKLGGANDLIPEHAIIVQNKDEIKIPLLLETLPSAQAFADAIESMSPEQQAFAKAFRSMQLEGTVFALAIIQLKPQLETLLNLPNESLTKEIKLTQQLFALFMDHQIPSDLLRYDGSDTADVSTKLTAVKGHVSSILDMIQEAKDEDEREAKQKAEFRKAETNLGSEIEDQNECLDSMPSMNAYDRCLDAMPTKSKSRSMRSQTKSFGGGGGGGGGGGMRGGGVGGGYANRSAPQPRSMMAPEPLDYMMPMMMQPQAAMMDEQECNSTEALLTMDEQMDELGGMVEEDLVGSTTDAADEQQNQQQQEQQEQQDASPDDEDDRGGKAAQVVDFTSIPATLDQRFKELDEDGSLRPTKLIVQQSWTKKFLKSLLAKHDTKHLNSDDIKTEKQNAFDLLDALTKSGALGIKIGCELHVVVAATHCFDLSLMETVVVANVDPILKMDHSSLLMAQTILDQPVAAMVEAGFMAQIKSTSPALLPQQQQ